MNATRVEVYSHSDGRIFRDEAHHGDGSYDKLSDATAAAADALSDEHVVEVRLVKTT